LSATITAPKYTAQNNLSDRYALLASGVPQTVKLGTFGPYLAGQTAQIRTRNVGVMTGLRVRVTASVTITTAAATPSPFGPYGLLSKVSFLDYNTTERIAAPGPMMYAWLSARQGRPWMPTGQGSTDTLQTILPTATGANQVLEFNLNIPLAADHGHDLTGAILAQTIVGEQFLRLTVNPNMQVDPYTPYLAAVASSAVALNSVTFDVWQDYLQPQTNQLPLIDLNTVQEFSAMYTSTDNIVVGGTKYIDYPNVRRVAGIYFDYINNATVTTNETDINTITLIANGNTNMREFDPLQLRKDMRNYLGGDIANGRFFLRNPRKPISTFIYSQVQMALAFATVTGTPYVAFGFESTYPLNTPLPGIAAGS
jgi:hypothetical protein